MSRHFTLGLRDEVARKMNREQYKNARHYLRWLARYIDRKINWEVVDTAYLDMITNGRNEISFEDLLI